MRRNFSSAAFSHRTKIDWAYRIQWLLNEQYPEAEKIILVMDNLNTHTISSLYEAFLPEVAFSLGHRRFSDISILNSELAVWYTKRNQSQKGVDWQFKETDARIKLKKLYPVIV